MDPILLKRKSNQPIKRREIKFKGSVVNRTLKRKVYTGRQLYKIKDKKK